MTETQKIVTTIVLWVILSFINITAFRAVDRQYKLKYFMTNVYMLNKAKIFFSFFDRKKGEIAKYVFWLNVVFHIYTLLFWSIFIVFLINRQTIWLNLSFGFVLGELAISIICAGFNFYYDVKSDKKKK